MSSLPENSSNAQGAGSVVVSREALQAGVQPFSNDICASWQDAASEGIHHVPIHEQALLELRDLAREGRIILLSAPRAGHGKTHLLGRVAEGLKDTAQVIALPWHSAGMVTWEASGSNLLMELATPPTGLQRVCGGVCATLLRRLIQVGRIPSADPAQALQVLTQDPLHIFHSPGPAKVIGDWFRRHFEQLRRPLAEVSGLEDTASVERWLAAMFHYLEQPTPVSLGMMLDCLHVNASAQLPILLKIFSAWKPVVLVADHMDGLYRDAAAGQAVTQLALALSGIHGVHLVLSMNQDLWDTSFGRNLPSAFEDRLTERSLALRGMDLNDAQALVRLRLSDARVDARNSSDFISFLDLERFFSGRPFGSVSARGLLRHAALKWREFIHPPEKAEAVEVASGEGFLLDAPLSGGALPSFDIPTAANIKRAGQQPSGAVVPLTPDTAAEKPEGFLQEPIAGKPVSPSSTVASYPPAAPENSYNKLRQMLSRLKVSPDSVPASGTAFAPAAYAAGAGTRSVNEILQARFESLRNEFAQNGHSSRIEWSTISDLVRLAGKRFPVVHYDEVELPGLLGRSLPRWSLQGMEIVFAPDDFNDVRYWKTVSGFVAGRLAELGAVAAASHEPAPQLKLVVFKGDYEGAALAALVKEEVIPPSMRENVDAVHLDTRSLASLSAMRQLVREAEEGRLSTNDPTAVLGALNSELDFFWKRVTRPKQG